ncbi:MAG TPA: agmatinase [Baekduia sp.]|uniref:agmatinase n=1 Tax=Baekduia sp. TaxID=2600305 RepID=UPI002BA83F60|nr:agmatinase [Baekduia sp.]HMJ34479.1 agmatinase [Baekduia sp.]
MTATSDHVTQGPPYGPADALRAPRYTGIRTFARCPHVTDMRGVDVAVLGVPFDTGTSFRVGARFGPEAVRSGSTLLRPYNANLEVDAFADQSVVDAGDLEITPGDAVTSLGQIAAGLERVVRAGVTPIVLGGDHTIVLGELRAHAAVHGPVALVLLDAHVDTGDAYYGQRYFHGTPFRRAVEEGLLQPERSVMAGMRGSIYDDREWENARDLGFDVIPCEELAALTPAEYGDRVRARVGDAPAFLSFDIDVVDPGFAPATGTPEVGGLLPREALRFVRSLTGVDFRGYDVVEVSPQLDGPAQPTALLAANVAYEFLGLNALARQARDAQGAS